MARRKQSGSLAVWMNDEKVGVWKNADRGQQTLEYDPSWLASPRSRPLSLSLPFAPDNAPHRGEKVRAYFDNLLPDSQNILERLAAKYEAASTQAFDLLREIGRDCVGAVQLLPEGEAPQDVFSIRGEPLTDSDIEQILLGVVRPVGATARDGELDFRISIAGAQEKTALLWHGDQWQRPIGATPSTHIFKLPLGRVGNIGMDLGGSVENEWLCARILRAYGVPVADCDIRQFGSQRVLVVKRFDRSLAADGSWLTRIPQEDFCQVMGVAPWRKYEADGGPGMAAVLKVLENSTQRQADRENFFRAQVLFWMLAAIDGHAKNFSIFIGAGGTYRLTPLYDVLSAWPVAGRRAGKLPHQKLKLAMAVRSDNAHYHLADILRRHWNAMARDTGVGPSFETQIEALLAQTPDVIAQVASDLSAGFPAAIAESIFTGLQQAADKLSGMPGN